MVLRWTHDIHTKFHEKFFQSSNNSLGGFTDTQSALISHKHTCIFFQNKERELKWEFIFRVHVYFWVLLLPENLM